MGNLKAGATYIYEHHDGVTYAREFGDSADKRFEIGRTYERRNKDFLSDEDNLWYNIRKEALSNEELQFALDRVKLIYELSRKDHGKE
jgi:hypothetical protein